jgi:hypothetical protein
VTDEPCETSARSLTPPVALKFYSLLARLLAHESSRTPDLTQGFIAPYSRQFSPWVMSQKAICDITDMLMSASGAVDNVSAMASGCGEYRMTGLIICDIRDNIRDISRRGVS